MIASNTLLIDGSFEELADELAQYLDERSEKNAGGALLHDTLKPLLEQNKREEVLTTLVEGSSVLNSVPEKGKTCYVLA